MNTRTDAESVLLIIETDLSALQVAEFVADAHVWVNTHLVGKCSALANEDLAVIEKYLAAHFITAREPRLRSAKFDDVQETRQMDEKVSEYLKIASSMDPCGIIDDALIGARRKPRWRVGAGFDRKLNLPRTSS